MKIPGSKLGAQDNVAIFARFPPLRYSQKSIQRKVDFFAGGASALKIRELVNAQKIKIATCLYYIIFIRQMLTRVFRSCFDTRNYNSASLDFLKNA